MQVGNLKVFSGLFKNYIDKWITVKNEATLSGNKGKRTLAKLMLNSLYGKFATSQDAQSKIPYLENDIVHYHLGEKERKNRHLFTSWKFYHGLRKRENNSNFTSN